MITTVFTLILSATSPSGDGVVEQLGQFTSPSLCTAQGLVAKRTARRAGMRRVVTACIETEVVLPDSIPGPQGSTGPRGRDGRDCKPH